MNNDVMHSSAQVDRSIFNNLVEVKETIATEINFSRNPSRKFGIYDLWNIRKNAKFASARIRRF